MHMPLYMNAYAPLNQCPTRDAPLKVEKNSLYTLPVCFWGDCTNHFIFLDI